MPFTLTSALLVFLVVVLVLDIAGWYARWSWVAKLGIPIRLFEREVEVVDEEDNDELLESLDGGGLLRARTCRRAGDDYMVRSVSLRYGGNTLAVGFAGTTSAAVVALSRDGDTVRTVGTAYLRLTVPLLLGGVFLVEADLPSPMFMIAGGLILTVFAIVTAANFQEVKKTAHRVSSVLTR